MQIAIVGAGFTPSEADGLRRAMATFRKSGTIGTYGERFISGMIERGYDSEFAARCFAQIEGFGEYGFPESHAASFAYLVYASAWMKRHYPAIFTCALLNSQPMGFYAPAQLVRDAREHGVEVRPVCINHSTFDHSLERNDQRPARAASWLSADQRPQRRRRRMDRRGTRQRLPRTPRCVAAGRPDQRSPNQAGRGRCFPRLRPEAAAMPSGPLRR